ncbi:shikimate dehydrogenase [Alkalicoccus luteus]|uniref:Shikimate dehydrogenase (NADP(+)) n=1 Tax=Alkalicoccus luteus TaxID=1237094 RepID=A0A969TTQ2_9BACI|nr:shikimate dehydrogenase [Alkalicoccus luteus]NJP36520.1 shikimate dehydrogenase [Alkalicoccus luteus]
MKIFGVIGDPISHTLSPVMHDAAYKETGLEASYLPFHTPPERLKDAVQGVRGLGIAGLNVTIPHKEAVIPFLDGLDPTAERIGAVNTIVREGEQLIGSNTDGEGYVRSLVPHLRRELESCRFLIIGAGGAARAAAITLYDRGAAITIANRTLDRAASLAEACGPQVKACSMQEAQAQLTSFDVIVNSTSIGMTPDHASMALPLDKLSRNTVVSDMIYTPLETAFLKAAAKQGAAVVNGTGMFVEQGALAFERWTGIEAPREAMLRAVLSKLKGGS